MKFIEYLYTITEGIGSSRNIYRFMPVFKIDKDENFLMLLDFLYGLKKLIEYINEEIEDHNKKTKIKIPVYKIKIKDSAKQLINKEIIDLLSEFIDNDLNNRDLFKKEFIKILIKLFKNQDQYKDFYLFCINNIKKIEFLITRSDNKYIRTIDYSELQMNYGGIIHDLVVHLFLNPKDIDVFGSETEGYDPYLTYRYSPASVLNELIAQQTNKIKLYPYYIKLSIISIKKDFKKIIEESKADDFIEKKFNEIFTLKNKKLIQKIKNVLLNNKIENFSFDEFETINILLKNNSYKEYFKTTLHYLDVIISDKTITTINQNKIKSIDDYGNEIETEENDEYAIYEFIERVIESIKFRKNKFSKNKNQTVEWKDFRTYFRDYPYILKLFPESKYPDNQIINNKNLKDDLLELLPEEKPELRKINTIIHKAVNIGQALTKKSRRSVFDIENKEDKIDFIIEKFSNLLKNQFNDNSKYYKIIEDELTITINQKLNEIANKIANTLHCNVTGNCVHFAELFVLAVAEEDDSLLDNFKVIEGYVDTWIGEGIPQQHTWIELKDGKKIDPTFEQFLKYDKDADYSKERGEKFSGRTYYNDTIKGTWFSDKREKNPSRIFKNLK